MKDTVKVERKSTITKGGAFVLLRKQLLSRIIPIVFFLLLIFDTKTAVIGAKNGVDLCLATVIPSLFPFIFAISLLNIELLGMRIPGLQYIGRKLNIPKGMESILILGFLGGYPTGASIIADLFNNKKISKDTASVLMGYCNNAGPAFIFGIISNLFSSTLIPWIIWMMQVLSALITAFLLPLPLTFETVHMKHNALSIVSTLKRSIQICASICGWIITFRILIAYICKLIVNDHIILLVTINGLLELSNGCLLLNQIPFEPIRFLLCSIFLSAGGICVLLQITSVVENIGLGYYFHGKILQTIIVSILSVLISIPLFHISSSTVILLSLLTAFILIIILLLIYRQLKKCWKL